VAGRCGCASSNATGASISAGACTTVTGAGTPASPAVIGVDVDPNAANSLQCGPAGLFAATAAVEDGSCTTVDGDGSLATPYEVNVKLDNDVRNLLDCTGAGVNDGLMATPDPLYGQSTGAYIGGGAPLVGIIAYVGQTVVVTDVNGFATITLPAAFPTGFIKANAGLGDVPSSLIAELSIDAATVGLNSFRVRASAGDGAPVIGGTLRVCWDAYGW